MRRGLFLAAGLCAAVLAGGRLPDGSSAASTLERDADPVVLTGAQLAALAGVPPDEIVAFRFDGTWQQIPVQVDERRTQSFGVLYGQAPTLFDGYSTLVYADAGTHSGADPNAAFDSDDELVFMARDAGGPTGATAEPTGTIAGTGVELTITDPLDPGAAGYVYLFRGDGSLDPGAGAQYVDYDFNLLSGAYLSTYNFADGPNPEDSTVVTPYYERHFGDRWLEDVLRIRAGASTQADILDRHKNLFSPGLCVRSEDTFNDAEGAFIINKSGPVRALRSYIGANSGPLTQREHYFYERRQDVRTFLRVHAIPDIMDFYDYSPAASGMMYRNSLNPGGVTIDGMPDTPASGAFTWEMVTGAQGTLITAGSIITTIPAFTYGSYYLDDMTPSTTLGSPEFQCTGDSAAYGASGLHVGAPIPCTDPQPSVCATSYPFEGRRVMYFDAPGGSVALAQERAAGANAPLIAMGGPWTGGGPDADGDGIGDVADNCPTLANASQTDGDADLLGDACEPGVYGTDTGDPDTDADGCLDGREVRTLAFPPNAGGDRDPTDFWDFYDTSGDRAIDLIDTLDVLAYFGDAATDGGPADLRDRDAPNAVKPWRTVESDSGIDLADALNSLKSFGHSCA